MGRDMVVSRYAIPTSILRVDGLSTGPPGFGVLNLWSLAMRCKGRLVTYFKHTTILQNQMSKTRETMRNHTLNPNHAL